jgi:hypothetical protein
MAREPGTQAAVASPLPQETGMALSFKPWQRMNPARGVPLGGSPSVLRLAARKCRATATPAWLSGLTQAMRAAGPGTGARPLHAVLAGGDFAPSEWLNAR